jgi:dTDP-4-dehydrorhamnose reductase
MRILIFGAKGQLGKDLVRVLESGCAVVGCDLPEVDIGDAQQVQHIVDQARPDVVINAAAYTDVEAAEIREEQTFRVNALGARHVALSAAACGAKVLYLSTDYVFDGNKRQPYETDEPVAASGVYARSKAAGEEAVLEANPQHFIVRTAWLYGPGGNNFVEKILQAARTRPLLRVVIDEHGSPTHTLDLARAIEALVKTDAYGVYHCVNAGSCSRHEFACAIVYAAGLTTPVEACGTGEFPSKAPRPAYSVLSNKKLEATTGHKMPSWKMALTEYMERRKTLE